MKQPLALTRFVFLLAVFGMLSTPAWGGPTFDVVVTLHGFADGYNIYPDGSGTTGYFTDAGYLPGQTPELFASLFCPSSEFLGEPAYNVNHPFTINDFIELTFMETFPVVQSVTLHGSLIGNPSTGSFILEFDAPSVSIGSWLYTLTQSTFVVPVDDGKTINITGDVTAPEPSYCGVLGIALAGLAFLRYRKANTQSKS